MAKNILPPSTSEPELETRRDVMKLSLAVAAFCAAMGIAGPGSAASQSKMKISNRKEGPKGPEATDLFAAGADMDLKELVPATPNNRGGT